MGSWRSTLRFDCLSCGQEHRVEPTHLGRRAVCAGCRARFVIGPPLNIEEVPEVWNTARVRPESQRSRDERRRLSRHRVHGVQIGIPELQSVIGVDPVFHLRDLNLAGLLARRKRVDLGRAALERLHRWIGHGFETPAYLSHPALRRPFSVRGRVTWASFRLSKGDLRFGMAFTAVPPSSEAPLAWLSELTAETRRSR